MAAVDDLCLAADFPQATREQWLESVGDGPPTLHGERRCGREPDSRLESQTWIRVEVGGGIT
jgi:hypothetical protein